MTSELRTRKRHQSRKLMCLWENCNTFFSEEFLHPVPWTWYHLHLSLVQRGHQVFTTFSLEDLKWFLATPGLGLSFSSSPSGTLLELFHNDPSTTSGEFSLAPLEAEGHRVRIRFLECGKVRPSWTQQTGVWGQKLRARSYIVDF